MTLEVGPGKEFTAPSQAAVAARDGDFVQIGPGRYVDCAKPKRADYRSNGWGRRSVRQILEMTLPCGNYPTPEILIDNDGFQNREISPAILSGI